MSFTLGKDGNLYLFKYTGRLFTAAGATPNDYSTPTLIFGGAVLDTDYTIYGNARDVTLELDGEEVDITRRATSGFRATASTVKDSTITFESLWQKNDTFFTWLSDAWLNNAEIAILAMDGAWDTSGNSGLIGNFTVPGFSREEPIADVMKSSVTLKGSSYIGFYKHP